MKILIVPLNWGLGHATRCIPLVRRFLDEGNEVVLGGDGNSLTILKQHYPTLRTLRFPALTLTYSKGNSQVGAMLRNLPRLLHSYIADRSALRQLLAVERFDLVVSDNRFGLYSHDTRCVYITHQLHISFPKHWHWAEPMADALHRSIIRHYDECWVPDYEDYEESLAKGLSHPKRMPKGVKYIGCLSRFETMQDLKANEEYDVLAIISGLEPQRTLFEQQVIEQYVGKEDRVLIVRGRPAAPKTQLKKKNITLVNHLDDKRMGEYIHGAKRVVARSGYSTIMDLYALSALQKADLTPTPGQSEQEYLWREGR